LCSECVWFALGNEIAFALETRHAASKNTFLKHDVKYPVRYGPPGRFFARKTPSKLAFEFGARWNNRPLQKCMRRHWRHAAPTTTTMCTARRSTPKHIYNHSNPSALGVGSKRMVAEVTAPGACSGPNHCHIGAGIAIDGTDTKLLMAIPARDTAARCRCGAVARQRRSRPWKLCRDCFQRVG
jgi:hypothetical protein